MAWFTAWLGPWWKRGNHVMQLSVPPNAEKEHVLSSTRSDLAELWGSQPEWDQNGIQASEPSANKHSPELYSGGPLSPPLFESFVPFYLWGLSILQDIHISPFGYLVEGLERGFPGSLSPLTCINGHSGSIQWEIRVVCLFLRQDSSVLPWIVQALCRQAGPVESSFDLTEFHLPLTPTGWD